jgi:sugar lactone lactonase YvrE
MTKIHLLKHFILLISLFLFGAFHPAIAQNVVLDWVSACTSNTTTINPMEATKAVRDAQGNVYTAGSFRGEVDFNPGPGVDILVTDGQQRDMFIQKLSPSGTFIWAKRIGGLGDEYITSIAIDPNGNVYTTGQFNYITDFDPGAGVTNLTPQSEDAFVLKLNSSGDFVWAKHMGGTGQDYGVSIATDVSGHVYTVGSFRLTVDFDPNAGVTNLTSAGGEDIFIQKLNTNGDLLWAKRIGGVSQDRCDNIVLDASGNIYTCGGFYNLVDFDPGAATNNLTAQSEDGFILKLNSAGNFIWVKQIGGSSEDRVGSLAVDANENVFSTGSFGATADFDPGVGVANLTSAGFTDIFILKLNSNGDYVWAKGMGSASSDFGRSIALDPTGNIYTVGTFQTSVDFDPDGGTAILTSSGSHDWFAQKLNAAGNYAWAKGIGGTGFDGATSILVDGNNGIYMTGYHMATTDFDPTNGVANFTGNNYGIITLKWSECVATTATVNQNICQGGSYTFNGVAQTTSGTYMDTLVNACGSDSIVTLHLTVIPTTTAGSTIVNPKRCGLNGSIALSSISSYTTLTTNSFSGALVAPFSTTGSATINNGEMQLTAATNSLNGALIYLPTSKPSGFTALFDLNMFSSPSGNDVADGISFNYGDLQASPIGHEEGMLNGNGLVIRFKEWQTQRVEVVYNGVVKGTYNVDLHNPKIRKVRISVLPNGKLDMSIGDQILCNNLDLGVAYSSDNKSSWKFAWGARTGGANNRHAIDNIEMYNNNGITFTNDNWTTSSALPFFNVIPNSYTLHGGNAICSSLIGVVTVAAFDASNFTTVNNVNNPTCTGRTITVTNSLVNDTLVWSDFASRPTLSNFNNLGNATFSSGSVQLTDNTGSQNGRIIFPQTPNAGVFTATFKARVWDGNNADGFSFNYGQIDNASGAEGGMMNTNTPGLSVCFPTWNTANIVVKYKNNVLTTVPNTGSGGNRASFFTPVEVSVNAQYQLTVKWNGTTYINNYDLVANSTYETDAKTNWQFGWAARTGGSFDRHQLDDILVVGRPGLLYSYNGGTTFETNATKTINNANAVTVVVKADGVCTPSTTNLAALAIPTFTPIIAICSGSALTLPTTSTNGIVGNWTPVANNLTATTYTFTPTGGGCTTTMTVNINSAPTITSVIASADTICNGSSVALYALPTGIGGIQVSTLAGSSIGYADGTGTAARFSVPYGVATDANGNVYVADQNNHRIRKITPAGVVTTLAGSGSAGFADGTGTTASFNYPSGVATDANGNVFVADLENHRIRKITPAGVVTTLAGSGIIGNTNATGTAASFNYPNGIATDATGNIYVADEGNHRIRKITSSGVVTSLAGNGISGFTDGPGESAQFHNPNGVATDAIGNVYVADYVNHRIRKITSGGVVSTLAGNGTDGFANGIGTSASFNYPTGVATDAVGNVYVADYLNHRIRKITPAGVVTTYAGSGISGNNNGAGTTATFSGPTGVAIDGSGNFYVVDRFNYRIRKINSTPPVTYSWSQSVTGINASMDSVLITPTSSTVYTVTGTNSGGCTASSTIQVVVKPNHTITASAGANGNISPSGNTAVCQGNNQTFTITANANYHIADVLVDGASIGTVASYTFSNVTTAHTISASFAMNCATTYGTLNENICQGSSYIFNGIPQSIAGTYLDTIQNVGGCDSIITLNLTTIATSTSTTNLTICSYDLPYTWNGLTFAAAGTQIAHLTNSVGCDSAATLNLNVSLPNLEISSLPVTSPYMVSTIAGTGSYGLVNGPGATAQFFTPMGVAIDSVGNIYVGDATNNRIRMITPSNVVSTYAGAGFGTADGPINTAQFNSPAAVVFDKFGNLFVSDQNSHKIRKISPGGIVSTLAGSGIPGFANGTGTGAQFYYPGGLATDTNGNVFVADLLNNRIRQITPGGVVTTYAGTGVSGTLDGPANTAQFTSLTGIAIDKNGNLFVTGGDRIRKITPSGIVSTLAGGSYGSADGLGSAAQFSSPQYLTTDALGNIYVPEFGGRIRKITPDGLVSTIASGYGFADGSATTAKFNAPTGIAIDLSGNIILSDRNNHRIRKITKGNYSMTICDGSLVTLNGTGSNNYSWAGPQAITNGVAFNAVTSGVYTVTATDTIGCVYTNSIAVAVNPTFTINASAGANGDISLAGNTAVCQGDNQTYYITPDANYQVADVLVDGVSVGAVYFYTFTNVTAAHTISASFVLSCVTSYETISESICQGSSYTFNGISQTATGTYLDTLMNTGGCDSIVTLNLTVNANPTITSVNATPSTICTGGSSALTATTTNVNTDLGNLNGPNPFIIGEAFTFTKVSVPIGGTVSQLLAKTDVSNALIRMALYSDAGNMPSIPIMEAQIVPAINGITQAPLFSPVTLPAGDYWVGAISSNTSSFFYNSPGTEVNYFLYINTTFATPTLPQFTSGATGSALFSQGSISYGLTIGTPTSLTYVWSPSASLGGSTAASVTANPTATTTYTVTASNAASCTAISTVTVTVKPNYTITASAGANGSISPSGITTVCEGNNITYNITANASYTIADVLVDGISVGGVSSYTFSNVTTARTISASFVLNCATTFGTIHASICQGSSYTFNGIARTIAGAYLDTLMNAGGCDSIVTLNLTIKSTSASTTNISICSSELPYSWNGLTFAVGGSQTAHFTNSVGCDSAATLNLTIKSTSASTTNLSICSSELPYSWNGLTFAVGGSQTAHFTNSVGCDSAATLNLTIKSTSASTTNISICPSELPYSWNGLTFAVGGSQTAHFTNSVGCDSAATLNLTIKANSASSTNLSICSHQLPYTWNGLTFIAAGTQSLLLTNSMGCDSVATFNLSVTPSTTTSTENMVACSSYTWHGNTYTQSGSYISPSNGCEIHVLNLTITHELLLSAKVFLQGAYDSLAGKMHDSLRVKGLIPAIEPYSSSPFNKPAISEVSGESVSANLLAISGDNAIVDWVFIELRSASNSSTIVATKRALLQRDGDIVSASDGISPVPFFFVPNGSYYVSIKHRNHLGVMSAAPLSFTVCTPTVINFTSTPTLYTNVLIANTPQKLFGSFYTLWSADANNNKNLKFNGLNNDKETILTAIGGPSFINNTLYSVYRTEDVNLDGKLRYNGTDNDRSVLINNIGVATPNRVIHQHTPN